MAMSIAQAAPATVWDRRGVRRSDIFGFLIVAAPVLLVAHFVSGIVAIEYAVYSLIAVAALPQWGPFVASLRRNSANKWFVLLFATLAIATVAAYLRTPSQEVWLQAKGLAAAAAWAAIYVVAFSAVPTHDSLARVVRWIDFACVAVSASVYVGALGHLAGFDIGEVTQFNDGTFRAFGLLGDQVAFVLVLPVLTSLAAARPVMVGFHFGALLLTGTRGAMLCLVVAVAAYVLMRASGRGRRRRLGGVAASVVVGALLWATPLSDVLLRRAAETPDRSAYSMRLVAMEEGIAMAAEHPWLGVGFNGFGAARRAVAEDWLSPNVAANGLSRTSNQYIQIATDGGVAAFLCMLAFAVFTIRNAVRVASWQDATPSLVGSQAWLIGVLVGNQTALWMLGGTPTGFFVFAVAGVAAGATRLLPAATTRRTL